MASSVFKKPNNEYQQLVYTNGTYWNSLNLETKTINTGVASGATKTSPKTYQLLGGGISPNSYPDEFGYGETNYTNSMIEDDSTLKQLLTQSTTMSQTVRNAGTNKYNEGEGWNRATWYPAVYSLKTKKFKCLGERLTYNSRTGRICYMEFTEI